MTMAIEAWYVEESGEDKKLLSLSKLKELGVLYWRLNPKNYENDEELRNIRESRGYNYVDILDICPEKLENYEEKVKNFYTEHIHANEEIRYCLEGSGYFDVRDKDDRWVRIWMKEGDMIALPSGIYHRLALDTGKYLKLMRLFVDEPVWTPFNRPQEEHPARKAYVNSLVPLEAH
ncbi:1,2-dihydroxy-3-keto-5-methylthiopentene dioxygenase 1-like [Telopea speciosissima]|uniref:1,2-dihydroxy-3-keto-5-methylthiopentene dioxygenase 1-like n=1 Tax=Telopea speciosissima TaxID=54955 RepID=UPI001CC395BB|nr:1,2-dihydroxy-3-keto-5-methylthiopentene dioxygenase 1-like [Telopea speciosissima]